MPSSRLLVGAVSIVTAIALLAGAPFLLPSAARASNSFVVFLPRVENKDLAPCPSTPTLVQPANGAALDTLTPLFIWHAAAKGAASTFYVDVSTDPTFQQGYDYLFVGSDPTNPCLGQVRYFGNLASAPAAPTTYYWRVSVVQPNGNASPFSPTGSFSVPATSAGTLLPAPAITAPADGATGVPARATFQWQPVAGALDYLVIWQDLNAQTFLYGYTTATQITSSTPLNPGTTYQLSVAARDTFGVSAPMSTVRFQTVGATRSGKNQTRDGNPLPPLPAPGQAVAGRRAGG